MQRPTHLREDIYRLAVDSFSSCLAQARPRGAGARPLTIAEGRHKFLQQDTPLLKSSLLDQQRLDLALDRGQVAVQLLEPTFDLVRCGSACAGHVIEDGV